MRRIFVSLLLLSLFFMGYAHEPEFSTAGFWIPGVMCTR